MFANIFSAPRVYFRAPEAWSALQEAAFKGDEDASALSRRCMQAGDCDLKRQQALAESAVNPICVTDPMKTPVQAPTHARASGPDLWDRQHLNLPCSCSV